MYIRLLRPRRTRICLIDFVPSEYVENAARAIAIASQSRLSKPTTRLIEAYSALTPR